MTDMAMTKPSVAGATGTGPLFRVDNLRVDFRSHAQTVRAVRGVSFQVAAGETFAIVGESGSGKTVSMMAVMRLLQSPPAHVEADALTFQGRDLRAVPPRDWWRVTGEQIAMVFQDALTALNPVYTVGWQIAEMFRVHRPKMTRREIRERSIELLRKVGIPEPARRLDDYPHQFSGGMRQRAMIAMAIALEPRLLIADEPTTALDVTIQAQILDLMEELQDRLGMAIIFITHDLGVVAQMAQRVVVMYAGQVVEQGPVEEIFERPRMPYTAGLIASIPRLGRAEKGRRLRTIPGNVPSLSERPDGCRFSTRCGHVSVICTEEAPALEIRSDVHEVRCSRWRELDLAAEVVS